MSEFHVSINKGNLPPEVATQYTTDDGIAIPQNNNLFVNGGIGIFTETNATDQILIKVKTGGFAWAEVSSNTAVGAQTATFCNAALTISLPETADLVTGSTVLIYADTSGSVVIQADTDQFIEIGGSTSTMAGTATSSAQGNIVELVFKPSDSTWHSLSVVGTWTTA
jgi:hypothetical protein